VLNDKELWAFFISPQLSGLFWLFKSSAARIYQHLSLADRFVVISGQVGAE
jgi:hypothetical protein